MAVAAVSRGVVGIALCLLSLWSSQTAVGQDLDLVREIGAPEGSPEYTFFRISDLALGPRGELLVLDGGAKTVAVYDSTGVFLRRFGREGNGPGEFQSPNRIRIEGDEVVVFDWWQSRVTRFSREGEVLQTDPLPRPSNLHLSRTYPMADGSIIGVSTFRASPGSPDHEPFVRVVHLADGDVDTLLSMEPGYVMWRAPEGIPWGVVPDPLGKTGAVAVWGDSMLALVDATEAKLQVVRVGNNGLRFLRPVTIPMDTEEVSPEDLALLEAKLRERSSDVPTRIELIPPTAVSDLTGKSFFDDTGSVWVETRSGEDQSRRWMVIARSPGQSRWISVPGNLEIMLVAGRMAYGVWKDELEVETVRIYRLN